MVADNSERPKTVEEMVEEIKRLFPKDLPLVLKGLFDAVGDAEKEGDESLVKFLSLSMRCVHIVMTMMDEKEGDDHGR